MEFYSAIGFNFQGNENNRELHSENQFPCYSTTGNGLTIEIYKSISKTKTITSLPLLIVKVKDLDSVLERLKAIETKIVLKSQMVPWGFVARIEDPDGVVVELSDNPFAHINSK